MTTKVQHNLLTVLDRIKDRVTDDEDDAELWADALDQMLDDLLSEDFFGTEGQLDPRGDGRDGEFSVKDEIQED